MSNTLFKFSSTGSVVWQKKIGLISASAISTDGSNIYFTSIDGTGKPYIAKLDQNGNIIWQRLFNVVASTVNITTDSEGNSYLSSSSSAGSTTGNDIIVAKYSTTGNLIWQKRISTSNSDTTPSIAVKDSSVYLSFMSGTTFSAIARIPADGSVSGTYGLVTFADTVYTSGPIINSFTTNNLLVTDTVFANGTTGASASDSTLTITTTAI